jgi:signal transduction histidine kinase
MQQLLDDLLEYAKSDSQELALELTNCEDILEDAMANLQADITESEATITQEPLPEVKADGMQLLQVFQNLLSNAVKYSGDIPPIIHVSAKRDGSAWLFCVRDNGIGIKPDKLAVIFEPFERLHSSGEYEGTGIGLATCQKAVQRHGGKIWVESTPGAGSRFFFTIPAHDGQ